MIAAVLTPEVVLVAGAPLAVAIGMCLGAWVGDRA